MTLTAKSTYTLNSGCKIPVIALGVYLTPPDETREIVYKALNAGYRHFDSAQWYENENEVCEGIAKWIAEAPGNLREDVFYTTKLTAPNGYVWAKESINSSFEIAHKNGLGYIDLLLIHSPMTDKEKRLGTWKALQEAVVEGKVKSIGVSNYGAHHIEELLNWEGLRNVPAVNQIELHPWLMRNELVSYCRDHDIYLEAYSPLARGLFFKTDADLAQLSEKYNRSEADILLRWSLQQGFITLPKTVHEERLKSNLKVFDFELTQKDVDKLSKPDLYKVTFPEWDPVTYEG